MMRGPPDLSDQIFQKCEVESRAVECDQTVSVCERIKKWLRILSRKNDLIFAADGEADERYIVIIAAQPSSFDIEKQHFVRMNEERRQIGTRFGPLMSRFRSHPRFLIGNGQSAILRSRREKVEQHQQITLVQISFEVRNGLMIILTKTLGSNGRQKLSHSNLSDAARPSCIS
ncbi:hypothetical protein AN936_14640 [Sphingopyxis macrogoltabida]|uniref:Uncharacterized protein n=1 Tax=Sphingopyxis macrogoltabida TaxID=33050 RepID=A0A0N9V1N1_SPHMC|nr:hypothetical protein AN936_14640 [Sphingopyxis macrogoltabida]KTE17003.1 hypothetical protein ATE71_03150 [Sphingopyxis sp. H115]